MKEERRKQMENLIAQRQNITMEELRSIFDVSMNTIRSDVAYLVESGAVEKVYGGVRIVPRQQVPLFVHRMNVATDAKRLIARCAESLINDGDKIYIDAGTTTMHLIDCLSPGKHVTVLTRSLYVMSRACENPNVELIVLPGIVNRRTNSVADVSTLDFLEQYQFDKAFMGVSGISPQGRLNVSTYIEYELKRSALHRSRQTYLLADMDKFGSTALMSYGEVTELTGVGTDREEPEFAALCEKGGVRLYIAPK